MLPTKICKVLIKKWAFCYALGDSINVYLLGEGCHKTNLIGGENRLLNESIVPFVKHFSHHLIPCIDHNLVIVMG